MKKHVPLQAKHSIWVMLRSILVKIWIAYENGFMSKSSPGPDIYSTR